jgi:histidinol-phosphate aminotransferase
MLIGMLLLERRTKVVLSEPGYKIAEAICRMQLATVAPVPLLGGSHDLEALAVAARDASLVWLPNPHNPTGTVVDPRALESFLEAVPRECIVALDEAYRPFVDMHLRPDVHALLERHPNLLVQRTFSKAHGLAGLRLGYGLGSAELTSALQTLQMPFSVNAIALAVGEIALDADDWVARVVEETRTAREAFQDFLADRGITFWPSQANFVTLRPPAPARLQEELAHVGLTVRDGADLGLPGWVRVTMGAEPEMARLCNVIDRVVLGWGSAR